MTAPALPLIARAALRLHGSLHPDAFAAELRQTWHALGSQRSTVLVSVSEACSRHAAQRQADAWRLLALESNTPFWASSGAGLRATLIVIEPHHDHLLLLASHGAAGRRALQRLGQHLTAHHPCSPVPLPESPPRTVLRDPLIRAADRRLMTAA